ncbi:MAG: hypothetical protein ACOWWH_04195 [Eubacteriaceae bacterium]
MTKAAGFQVHDLRIDQQDSDCVGRVKDVIPNIVGMSSILTLATKP